MPASMNFMQDKEQMVVDLQKALEDDNIAALRILVATKPGVNVLRLFLPRIVDLAIDSSSPDRIVLAREVLLYCKDDSWVKSNIQKLVVNYLVGNDEWHYRRIAELYSALNYEEALAAFLVLCQANANVEIQEIRSNQAGAIASLVVLLKGCATTASESGTLKRAQPMLPLQIRPAGRK